MTIAATRAPSAEAPRSPRDAIARTWRATARWRERRAARRALGELEDHMLKDIGIARSEIDAAVNGRLRRARRDMTL